MTKKLHFIGAIALALLFISCGSTRGLKSEAFPGLYGENPPVSILIMPPINTTSNVDAKDYFYYTLNQTLADAGYYVYPPLLAMQTLQTESAYDSEMFIDGDISKFGTTFGADLLLFTTITEWDKSVIGGKVTVGIDYVLRSTSTGEIVYNRSCRFACDTSQTGGSSSSLVALAVKAVAQVVSTVTTDYVLVARNCNYYALASDLPAGKYNEAKFGLDGAETAGNETVKYTVQRSQMRY